VSVGRRITLNLHAREGMLCVLIQWMKKKGKAETQP